MNSKTLTLETAKQLHQELWSWLAENPERGELSWPRWETNGGDVPAIDYYFFACEVAGADCASCPLAWPRKPRKEASQFWCAKDPRSMYFKFCYTDSPADRAAIAREIAGLPWRLRKHK
jgi:hypothetical protein